MLRGADLIFGGGKRGGIPSGWVEVKYIESSAAGQRIDTGVEMSELGRKFVIRESYSTTTTRQLWGNASTGWFFGCSADGYYEVNSNKSTFAIKQDEAIDVVIDITSSSGGNLLAKLSYTSETSSYTNNSYTYPKRTGTAKLFAFSNSYWASGHRVYSCKAYTYGVLVLHLVPVRNSETNEGAMCDVLTGTIYYNAGTGSFVVGPDKGAWTNPYGTPVFMFDGLRNKATDTHDNSSTVWSDCMGFLPDIDITGTGVFEDDGLLIDGTTGSGIYLSSGDYKTNFGIPLLASMEHGYTVELVLRLGDNRNVGGNKWVSWDGTSGIGKIGTSRGDLPFTVSTASPSTFGGYGTSAVSSVYGGASYGTGMYGFASFVVVVDIDHNETQRYKDGALIGTCSGGSCAGFKYNRFGVFFCRDGYTAASSLCNGSKILAYRFHSGVLDANTIARNCDTDKQRFGTEW